MAHYSAAKGYAVSGEGNIMMVRKMLIAGVACAAGVGVLAACGTDEGSEAASSASAAPTAPYVPVAAKEWRVDTSGWWVPEDPTGCLNETTTCPMSAWPTREYKTGQVAANVFREGDTLTLYCKAPTPIPIRNSVKTEAVYWYYAQEGDNVWWIPDIYVTKDGTAAMAEGVPDCPSNTPGINGGPPPSQTAAPTAS
jgi:hypothetical protein